DVLQNSLHSLSHLRSDYSFAAREIAIFRRVADGVAHIGEASFVNQIHNQFHLMDTLKIGHFRRVASVHQRLVTGLNQSSQPPTATTHLIKTKPPPPPTTPPRPHTTSSSFSP